MGENKHPIHCRSGENHTVKGMTRRKEKTWKQQ